MDESAAKKVVKDFTEKFGKDKISFIKTDVSKKTDLESKL